MTKKDIQNLLKERETVELKSSLSLIKEISEAISGFANTKGGKVLIGVDDAGRILGVQIGKGTTENLVNRIGQNTDPKVHPKISVEEMDGKKIILVEVKESLDKLVLAFGRPFKRVGKSTVKMGKDEYERLILEKHKDKLQFDTQSCVDAQFKDIDPGKVRWFLDRAREGRGFDVLARTSVKETLERLELFRKGQFTNTAILLFAKRPQKFFVQSKIRCGRIKGTDNYDFLDMKVLEGTIPELREGALKFAKEHIKRAVYFDANQRYDKWEYPVRALEELITNALAHRDYFSNSDIQLSIYDNRIEIWNPGELPKPLTPEDLKHKHKSIPRNKLLASQLFLIKHIERWGMGTNRVMEEMKQNNLPEPEFKNLSGGFEVILFGPGKSFEKEIEKEKTHVVGMNERQKRAVEYAKEKGMIKREEYIKINKVSHTTASKELKNLVETGIFRSTGKGKYLRYELTQG